MLNKKSNPSQKLQTIDNLCGQPPGSFLKYLKFEKSFPISRNSGLRFHTREYNNGKYEVYGATNSVHICECLNIETADIIAAALEKRFDLYE